MEHKILDFDLFMREKKHETMTVKLFGENYEIPMEVPAIVPVLMARAEMSMDEQQNTVMIMRAADAMFGAETVDKLCAKGMTSRELAALVMKLFSEFSGVNTEDDDVQEVDDEDSRVTAGGKRRKK